MNERLLPLTCAGIKQDGGNPLPTEAADVSVFTNPTHIVDVQCDFLTKDNRCSAGTRRGPLCVVMFPRQVFLNREASPSAKDLFNETERSILLYRAQGMSNLQIARRTGSSEVIINRSFRNIIRR